MNILSVCTKNDINNLISIVKIINYIKIIIPVFIIIFTIIKLIKSEGLNKSLIKLFIVNMIISILIFILPNLIYLLNGFINNEKIECMKKIDKNVINVMNILNKSNDDITEYDYKDAYDYYLKIKDKDIQNELLNDIEILKYLTGNDKIEDKIKLLIEKYKESLDINVYNEILRLYKIMEDNNIYNELSQDINIVKNYNDILESINALKDNYEKSKYNEIVNNIDNLDDAKIKEKLNNKLLDLGIIKKLDVTSGLNTVTDGSFGYVIAIPDDPIEDMPIIVGLNALSASTIYSKIMPQIKTKFIYIEAHTSAMTSWQDDNALNRVIDLINDSVNKYKINKDKIIVVGYSIGAMGAWEIVSKNPNYFSDAIIVSCNGPYFRANSFINTRLFAYSGDTGADETGYAARMQDYVKQINELGGKAYYTQAKNTTHRGSGATLVDPITYKKVFDE